MSCRKGLPAPYHLHQTLSDGSLVLLGQLLHFLKILVCQVYLILCPAGTSFSFFSHTFNCVCIYIYCIFLLVLDLCHYLIVSRVFIVWSFSYPPPREKCAAPNCTNSYKYRDSKSKLPLCSLHCYRAIHQKMQPLIAC